MCIRRALSLVESLLLIIVILLLMLLFSAGAGTCNGNNFTTVCASHLRGIGQAFYIYAQDDPQVFPAIGSQSFSGQMRVFYPGDRVTPPWSSSVPSPTVDLWTVLRGQNALADQFICPWTQDVPDPAPWPQDYYDFYSPQNLSYAYQFQHDPDHEVLGTSSDPRSPLMADSNPYIKGGIVGNIYADRLSPDHGNSTNHRLRSRGQNVLFQDAHVDLVTTPGVGLYGRVAATLGDYGFDNIYTLAGSLPPYFLDPGVYAPNAAQCNLSGHSDACLVP